MSSNYSDIYLYNNLCYLLINNCLFCFLLKVWWRNIKYRTSVFLLFLFFFINSYDILDSHNSFLLYYYVITYSLQSVVLLKFKKLLIFSFKNNLTKTYLNLLWHTYDKITFFNLIWSYFYHVNNHMYIYNVLQLFFLSTQSKFLNPLLSNSIQYNASLKILSSCAKFKN